MATTSFGLRPQARSVMIQQLESLWKAKYIGIPGASTMENFQNKDKETSHDHEKLKLPSDSESDSEFDKELKAWLDDDDDSDDNDKVILSEEQFSSEDLSKHLINQIRADSKLYSRILRYEPLEIQTLFQYIRGSGINCKKQQLCTFLDSQGIHYILPLEKRSRNKEQYNYRHKYRKRGK